MGDAGAEYLLGRVLVVEEHVRAAVVARRCTDPTPDDPFRGLYLSDDTIDRILDQPPAPPARTTTGLRRAVEEAGDAAEQAGQTVRLRELARRAGLEPIDVEMLLIALAPDLDPGFERLYGYLNDDVTRRRASIALALELAGGSPAAAADRARASPGAPLVDRGLMVIEDPDRPMLTRALRVPDRVVAHLLGDDTADPALLPVLVRDQSPGEYLEGEPSGGFGPAARSVAAALGNGVRLLYLRERVPGTGAWVAAAALRRAGHGVLRLDLDPLPAVPDPVGLVGVAEREALLGGAGLVAGPLEALVAAAPATLRALAGLHSPVMLVGTTTWDPARAAEVPLVVDLPTPDQGARAEIWSTALSESVEPAALEAVRHFVLGPAQVARAVRAARATACLAGRPITGEDLRRGARAQNAAGLERLARRVEPGVHWADLVLPATVLRALRELTDRARHRDLVLNGWRMRPGGGRGRGVLALFTGDSGTGKTMSAEVIAADLGLDLYAVNLATVIDKYVGETEKNLERVFTEAAGVNAVLLFDEADAIFAKRGEVRDAHDRYANIESAYLLQRLETFDGLAILATNLRANIDSAFLRRLDAVVDFPAPDETSRLALWQRCLALPLPCGTDLDLEFCAHSFALSGGNIRSAAVTAAYLAAGRSGPVGMADVIAGVRQEYRKLGRLATSAEFGPWLETVG